VGHLDQQPAASVIIIIIIIMSNVATALVLGGSVVLACAAVAALQEPQAEPAPDDRAPYLSRARRARIEQREVRESLAPAADASTDMPHSSPGFAQLTSCHRAVHSGMRCASRPEAGAPPRRRGTPPPQ
jgi:hypothetical protein